MVMILMFLCEVTADAMNEDALHDIAEILAGIDTPEDMKAFLRAILTPRERERLILRWRLVCLLEAGMPQRVIAETLGVSLCKITRGSHELKHGPSLFSNIVKRHARLKTRQHTTEKDMP